MTPKELREKLAAKQDHLAKIFAEAKQEDGTLALTKSATLDITDSQKAVEKIRALNAELDDLGTQIEEAAELEGIAGKAAAGIAARKKADPSKRPAHPGGGKDPDGVTFGGKSLGELVAKDDRYAQYAKGGAAGGLNFQFEDLLPSDMFAKSGQWGTMGKKTLMETTAGWAPESTRIPGFVEATTRPIQLLDIIPVGQTGQESVVYMEETTRTHSSAERAEGAAFAESAFAFTERSTPVRKITDSLPVTDEQLEDVAQVESYINGRLIFGLRQRLDTQVLVGDGTAPNLSGILDNGGIQTQAKGADPVPDAFYKAMVKVRVTGRAMPTHHVIHSTDWQGVRLLRTADGIYIWGNPSEAGPERMWGLPVVQTEITSVGQGMVGSFMPQWLQLMERRGVDVQVGYVGTQFTEGKRTVRADMRAALAIYRPAAFCELTGLNA